MTWWRFRSWMLESTSGPSSWEGRITEQEWWWITIQQHPLFQLGFYKSYDYCWALWISGNLLVSSIFLWHFILRLMLSVASQAVHTDYTRWWYFLWFLNFIRFNRISRHPRNPLSVREAFFFKRSKYGHCPKMDPFSLMRLFNSPGVAGAVLQSPRKSKKSKESIFWILSKRGLDPPPSFWTSVR